MPTRPIRDGFHAITPYLFAQGASQLIEFISAAFDGEVTFRKARPDGVIMHAEMRIGDSMLMVAEPTEQFGPAPTSIYLYVTDCDAVYRSALDSGGVSVFPIMTLPSGERYGGIKDPLRQHLVGCHARRGRVARRGGKTLEGIQDAMSQKRTRTQPNHAMEPTASRRTIRLCMSSTPQPAARRARARGG